MFTCFFGAAELAAVVSQQLGHYRVAPAAWQNYLQCQDDAQQAAANYNFAQLQVLDDESK